jgi:hypothetical protein
MSALTTEKKAYHKMLDERYADIWKRGNRSQEVIIKHSLLFTFMWLIRATPMRGKFFNKLGIIMARDLNVWPFRCQNI